MGGRVVGYVLFNNLLDDFRDISKAVENMIDYIFWGEMSLIKMPYSLVFINIATK